MKTWEEIKSIVNELNQNKWEDFVLSVFDDNLPRAIEYTVIQSFKYGRVDTEEVKHLKDALIQLDKNGRIGQ
jgi:hypothetical protein